MTIGATPGFTLVSLKMEAFSPKILFFLQWNAHYIPENNSFTATAVTSNSMQVSPSVKTGNKSQQKAQNYNLLP
jgi:hypothetical protein